MNSRLTQLLDTFIPMGVPWYNCAVTRNGIREYQKMDGFLDPEKTQPVQGNERVNIYSCSKVITCAAALQLLEKKLYKLNDELKDYMPEFASMNVRNIDGTVRPARTQITIENLFTMTAGFSYNLNTPNLKAARSETNGRCQTRESMKYLAQDPLLFDPGQRWEYSLCHDVLAAFVEVITNQKFEDYVEQNIFKPLGMNDSTFLLDDSQLDTVAPQYAFDANAKLARERSKTIDFKLGTQYASGGAGCISTMDDMAIFLEALRIGDTILKRETIDLMTQPRLNEELKRSYWINVEYNYGLGVRCPEPDNGIVSDFGWGGAAGSFLAIDRVRNITLVHIQHLLSSPNQDKRIVLLRHVD
ncbi:MAG: beta-lactamase family protein [Lentisphaerae bacterium]|nr:beta-lactamase family protein [Lentisphaerota bacterium]